MKGISIQVTLAAWAGPLFPVAVCCGLQLIVYPYSSWGRPLFLVAAWNSGVWIRSVGTGTRLRAEWPGFDS